MGFSQKEVETTIYYWWWRALRLNTTYKAVCNKTFIGPVLPKMYETIQDFGTLKEKTFEEWWWANDCRGSKLFEGSYEIEYLDHSPTLEMLRPGRASKDTKYIFAAIPMQNCSIRDLKKQFAYILKHYHVGKRGRRSDRLNDEIKYKVLGKPKLGGLKTHFKVYEHYLTHNESYWKVAQATLDLTHKIDTYKSDDPDLGARNDMSGKIKRHLDKANALIKNAGYGSFPDYKY